MFESRRLWLVPLVAIATINIALGVWLSLDPQRTRDLETLASWTRAWIGGTNVYADPESVVDYPPWALVLLAPLAALEGGSLRLVWVLVNIGLVAAVVRMLSREADEPRGVRLLIGALLAACACFRTLNQFSLLSYTLALAGARSASPVRGGVLLGLSLFKPQIGGVMLLWTAIRSGSRRVSIALAIPLILTLVFSLRADVSVDTLAAEYWSVISQFYDDAYLFEGHTDLKSWLILIWPAATGLATSAIVAIILLPPMLGARGAISGNDDRVGLAAAGGIGAVFLLATRHLSYDLVLLLPVLVAWRVPPFSTRSGAGSAERVRFFAVAALMVAALPTIARWLPLPQGLAAFMLQADRLLCLCVWLIVVWSLWMPGGTRPERNHD